MKARYLFLALAALLAAGGLWLARSTWRTQTFYPPTTGTASAMRDPASATGGGSATAQSSLVPGSNMPGVRPNAGSILRPPVPNRRFTDFTPEQRVQFAREGLGPGG